MRIQSIYFAIALILLCSYAAAQLEQTSASKDQLVPHLSITGTNVFPGAPPLFRTDKFTRGGLKTSPPSIRNVSSSQSQISVIDTAIVRATWDTTRHLCSFNAKAKRTSDLTQKLKGDLWVDSMRVTDAYDASNNMLSDLNEHWLNGQWVNISRHRLTYDAQGNMLSDVYEQWSNGWWAYSSRSTFTYDAQGNILSRLYEYWSNGQWVNVFRHTYAYDAANKVLSDLFESWLNGQWMNISRHTYEYDASNNMLSDLFEYWNGQWVNSWRDTFTYGASGNMLTELSEEWSNGQWVNTSRYTLTYDAQGNMLSDVYERWLGSWVNSSRSTFTYDAHGNLTSFSYDTWLNSSWTPTGGDFGVIDSAGNVYTYSGYNFTFTRKLIITESRKVPASYSLSQNYPNPFNPSTTIKYELPRASHVVFKVFNTLGQEVETLVDEAQEPGYKSVKFDGSRLSSGVYFYRLQAGDFVQSKRLLLVK